MPIEFGIHAGCLADAWVSRLMAGRGCSDDYSGTYMSTTYLKFVDLSWGRRQGVTSLAEIWDKWSRSKIGESCVGFLGVFTKGTGRKGC